jgi:hypothetical protein
VAGVKLREQLPPALAEPALHRALVVAGVATDLVQRWQLVAERQDEVVVEGVVVAGQIELGAVGRRQREDLDRAK